MIGQLIAADFLTPPFRPLVRIEAKTADGMVLLYYLDGEPVEPTSAELLAFRGKKEVINGTDL